MRIEVLSRMCDFGVWVWVWDIEGKEDVTFFIRLHPFHKADDQSSRVDFDRRLLK